MPGKPLLSGANIALAVAKKRIATLEAAVQEEKARADKFQRMAEGVKEIDVHIREGRFDARVRAEWVRAMGQAVGEFFVLEGAANYYETRLHPHGPHVPGGFGSLTITFQRDAGLTPAMVAADVLTKFAARFRKTDFADVRQGGRYLVAFTPETVPTSAGPAYRWALAWGKVLEGGGGRSLHLRIDGEAEEVYKVFPAPVTEGIAELYELRDPFAPRPEYLPEQGKWFVMGDESEYVRAFAVAHRGGTGSEDPLPMADIPRGTRCQVFRRASGRGGLRWYVMPEGWEGDEPPVSFPDNGEEVPPYLEPVAEPFAP